MKKVPAIQIELGNCCHFCKSIEEYNKVKKHLNKTKQIIISESLQIINDAETLEEIQYTNPSMWWNDLADIDKKYHIGLYFGNSNFQYPIEMMKEEIEDMYNTFFNL